MGFLYLPGDCLGFLPSTVPQALQKGICPWLQSQYHDSHCTLERCFKSSSTMAKLETNWDTLLWDMLVRDSVALLMGSRWARKWFRPFTSVMDVLRKIFRCNSFWRQHRSAKCCAWRDQWKMESRGWKIRRLSIVASDFNVLRVAIEACYNPYLHSLHSFPPLQHLKNFFPAQAEKLLNPKKARNLLFEPEINSCHHQLLFEKFGTQHLRRGIFSQCSSPEKGELVPTEGFVLIPCIQQVIST